MAIEFRHGGIAFIEPPSFEVAWQLYLAQLFYGMVWSVVPPGTQPEDAIESACTRFALAIADHDAFIAVHTPPVYYLFI